MAKNKKTDLLDSISKTRGAKQRNVKRVNCEFEPDIYEQIKITSWLTEKSMNGLINDAVKEYLAKYSNDDLEAIKKLAQKIMK